MLQQSPLVLTSVGYDIAYSGESLLPLALEHLFTGYRLVFFGVSFADPDFAQVAQKARRRETASFTVNLDAEGPHIAFVATRQPEAGTAVEWSWSGKRVGIEPIHYYNPDDGHHIGLVNIVRWLLENGMPAPLEGTLGADPHL